MTMQNDLKTLENRWGLALQSAAFGVWDLDPRAQRVHYSPEWKAMLGYGGADEADSTAIWRERVHPDDLPPMITALDDHLSGRSADYGAEFRMRAADGGYRWMLSRGRVVERDPAGAPLRMVGTLTDMTDRHELVTLRTERDRADAANRAKTEFLSRMSHELRTPLNAVLGFAQLLALRLGDGDIDGQRRQVAHIEQAGWHLLAMINDVLDLSRVESGQLAMHLEAVDLATLWQQVVAMLAPQAARRNVKLRGAMLPLQAAVQADPVRLKQVLINLTSNAIKYNRPGGTVGFAAVAAAGCWRLSVSDTGLGIPAAQMPHLFEAFNRLGREASDVEGVGIGLVLTRRLVEGMGGTITVRSTQDEGTTVEVELAQATAPPST